MPDEDPQSRERFQALGQEGLEPRELYVRARADGLSAMEAFEMLQEVSGLSGQEALAVMKEVEREPVVAPYRPLKAAGAGAYEVYTRARADGVPVPDAIGIIRELFDLSLRKAAALMRQAEGRPPAPFEEPIGSEEELCRVLKRDLGFCGCGESRAVLLLLRDVLRFAKVRYASAWDDGTRELETRAIFDRLGYEATPGVATWFLYLLDFHEVIWHGFVIGDFGIMSKGEWLLDALERFYPDLGQQAEP